MEHFCSIHWKTITGLTGEGVGLTGEGVGDK